jgi:hypothetical protein
MKKEMKTCDVPAYCLGTKGMVTLEREGVGQHHYTAVGVPENQVPIYEFPHTCPECAAILKEHYADLDRMKAIIEGPERKPVGARPEPEPFVPAVEDVTAGPIQDVLAQLQMKEPAYAASGEQ